MHVCHIEQYVQFQLCVCVYICVCLVLGVPPRSFVISPSADCDMETPAISFTELFACFRLSHTSLYDPLLTFPYPPLPLPYFLSSRVAAPFGFLTVYQTHQQPPPPLLCPASPPPPSLFPRSCTCMSLFALI